MLGTFPSTPTIINNYKKSTHIRDQQKDMYMKKSIKDFKAMSDSLSVVVQLRPCTGF